MSTKINAVRFFQDETTKNILAVVHTEPEQFLIRLDKKIAYIDVDETVVGSYIDAVKSILSTVTDLSKLAVLPGKTTEFSGVEIPVKGFETFDLNLDKANFILDENNSSLGSIKKRTFSYDTTDPVIQSIIEENDARIKYYVKPKYFDFIKSNVENSFIKGMGLIGVPGTGKSTDAIAVIRELNGIILIAQLSGGMLENNLFVNTKPNRVLSNYIERITSGEILNETDKEQYELLSKSSSSFLEVDEIIIRAIKLNCPVLLDEFAYANILLKARFNTLTDGTVVFRHEGMDYELPDNFFLFLTWNPGDQGTTDIPNALKTRFPIHIIPAIDKKTHYERIKSFCRNQLGYKSIDESFVNQLYTFGELVQSHQQTMKHSGGHFTIRATQMFLTSVLTECVDKERFILELKSKFVNSLWGTNYEMTEAIESKLLEPVFSSKIDSLWNDYPVKPIVKSTKPISVLDLMIDDITVPGASTDTATEVADTVSKELDDIWG